MVKTTLICDRCGKETAMLLKIRFTLGESWNELYTTSEGGMFDFCEDCAKEILSFACKAKK